MSTDRLPARVLADSPPKLHHVPHPLELVRVADRVELSDPVVLDDERHRCVVVAAGIESEALASVPGITQEQASVLVNSGLTSLEALLQAEVADLADIPQIGEQAGAILEAAKAEAGRRTLKVGESSPA